MLIREINKDDIIEVRALLEKGVPYVLPHHHYIYWMMCRNYRKTNLVVTDNDKIIGFLCSLPNEDNKVLFIWQLVIDSSYRNRGIASQLLEKLHQYAKEKDFRSIELTIDNENRASEHTFIKFAESNESALIKIDEYKYENNYDNVYKIDL